MKYRKFGTILALSLSAICGAGFFYGCGGLKELSGNSTLVIKRTTGEGFVEGFADAEVGKAIEEKFKRDTGKDLTLTVDLYTEAALNSNIDGWFSSSKTQIDGVKHYVVSGGSMVINYAKQEGVAKDLESYVQGSVYQQKINENDTKHIVERSGYMNIEGEFKYTVLNDYANERGWGWAINKTFWQDAYEKNLTTLNPEDYDAANPVYKNLKISEYEAVLKAIQKSRENAAESMKTPMWAYGWDLVRLFGSLYGVTNLGVDTVVRNGESYYVPPQLGDGYAEFMDWNAHLVNEKIWEDSNTAVNDNTRLGYFLSGASAVYMAYPDIDEVITACRTFEKETDWEYMICGPLAKEDGTVTGFTKREKTFSGLVVPSYSGNAQLLIDFIDWMYSDRANYDLCKYGREGIDWVATTVAMDGVTYDGWKYPDGKEADYLKTPPYSGIYCILENVNVSDRIDTSYSERELVYYVRSLYASPENYGFQYYTSPTAIEGVYIPETPSSVISGETQVVQGWISGSRANAWSGSWDTERYATFAEYYADWVDKQFDASRKGWAYVSWHSEEVKRSLDFFTEKFGVI